VIVTDLPDRTWGDVFNEDDDRADEQVVRFLNLEKLSDDEFKQEADEIGHNAAVAAVDFRPRYREHLQGENQQDAINSILDELDSGRDVWLVCYENTDEKFCHREILKAHIQDQRARRGER